MEIELILRDFRDMIHDVKAYSNNAYDDRRDADRVFTYVGETVWQSIVAGDEGTLEAYDTVAEGLVEASQALHRAVERFDNVAAQLVKLMEDLEYEAISHKVQSK